MKTAKRKNKPTAKFSSISDAYKRAAAGCEDSQRCILGFISNTGCNHLIARQHKDPTRQTLLWQRAYHGIGQYLDSLVGEYGIPEVKAEREVLAELNSARSYSNDISLTDESIATGYCS